MDLPPLQETETPYGRFTEGSAERRGGFDLRLQPYVTTTDEDGSIVYEEEDFPLLWTIIRRDDTRALEQYLVTAQWAIPRAPAIPVGLQEYSADLDYFLFAAQRGALGVLQMLLAHGTESNDPHPSTEIRFKDRGYELLNVAARWGHFDMVKFLLENQPLYADLHGRDPKGFTPITSAADFYSTRFLVAPFPGGVSSIRNEAVINLLLDRGACACDVVLPTGGREKSPDTLLTLAVRWAGPELLKTLIERGADIHAKVIKSKWGLRFWNETGETFEADALFIACTVANFNAVETLIDYSGVDAIEIIHSRDSRGSLPIHWATQNALADGSGQCSAWLLRERVQNITSIIGHLLDLDPTTINAQDNSGNTPLHYATRAIGRHDELYSPVLKLLCDRGGDSSIRNNKGQTPLHTLFKRDGIEPRYETTDEYAPVIDTSAIFTLLAHGANATDVDDDGNTPLHYVAEILHYANAVSVLLDSGADPTRRNLNQETALHRAARGHYRSMHWRITAEERIEAQEDMMQRGSVHDNCVKKSGMRGESVTFQRRKEHWVDQMAVEEVEKVEKVEEVEEVEVVEVVEEGRVEA
ncbi:related to ankyrin [Fusarium torulosum]|uniref:Related to ankyrin n=1 Tax=Fusarium torulosum TaxID=33205 RepID=A0AAE8M7D2_9HYPO|nr:related to ankyrin [Fusarium torulosum]